MTKLVNEMGSASKFGNPTSWQKIKMKDRILCNIFPGRGETQRDKELHASAYSSAISKFIKNMEEHVATKTESEFSRQISKTIIEDLYEDEANLSQHLKEEINTVFPVNSGNISSSLEKTDFTRYTPRRKSASINFELKKAKGLYGLSNTTYFLSIFLIYSLHVSDLKKS